MQLLVGSLVRLPLGHALLAEPGPQTTSREIKTGPVVQTHREPAPPSALRTSPVLSLPASCLVSRGTALGLSHLSHPWPQPTAFLPPQPAAPLAVGHAGCDILTLIPCQSPDYMRMLACFLLMPSL